MEMDNEKKTHTEIANIQRANFDFFLAQKWKVERQPVCVSVCVCLCVCIFVCVCVYLC